MVRIAREVMTADPACCTPNMTIDQVARLMAHNDCGEIPVVDSSDQPVGVITDRDIVCRVVAEGKNPVGYTAGEFMTQPVVTVRVDTPIDAIVSTMEQHQIRRVPVVDEQGRSSASLRRPTWRAAQESTRSPSWYGRCRGRAPTETLGSGRRRTDGV